MQAALLLPPLQLRPAQAVAAQGLQRRGWLTVCLRRRRDFDMHGYRDDLRRGASATPAALQALALGARQRRRSGQDLGAIGQLLAQRIDAAVLALYPAKPDIAVVRRHRHRTLAAEQFTQLAQEARPSAQAAAFHLQFAVAVEHGGRQWWELLLCQCVFHGLRRGQRAAGKQRHAQSLPLRAVCDQAHAAPGRIAAQRRALQEFAHLGQRARRGHQCSSQGRARTVVGIGGFEERMARVVLGQDEGDVLARGLGRAAQQQQQQRQPADTPRHGRSASARRRLASG